MKYTRSALKYHGGKNRIAPWIISLFPRHVCYVEPFGGSAGVLLQKPPSIFEVYNDRDEYVSTFFKVLRDSPDDLIRMIELTPYSRSEHDHSIERLVMGPKPETDLEVARLFYTAAWQTRHWPCHRWKSGWRFQRQNNRGKSVVSDWNNTDPLSFVAERMKLVQIESRPAVDLLSNYDGPETLFYLDPPYLPEVRNDRWAKGSYFHEMSAEDHESLLNAISGIEGMCIISGYDSDMYNDMLPGWEKRSTKNAAENKAIRQDIVWMNPAASWNANQMSLFTGKLEAAKL